MEKRINIVYWKDDDFLVGFLEPYPDYRTQGRSLEELIENLKDIYRDILNKYIEARESQVMEISL